MAGRHGRYVVGLIGSGIGTSLSPDLHEREADELGLRYIYQLIDIGELGLSADDVGVLVAQARRRMRLTRVGWITCKRCGVLHDQGDRPFMRAPRQEVLGAPAPVAPVNVPEGSPRPPIDRLEGLRLCPVCRMALNAILDC